ncbi:MAG: DUF3301 domain-containing protein [Magnetococcales bacterium]|nr:DUF3301 domain-containing protein [Magnetococcales bacterium]
MESHVLILIGVGALGLWWHWGMRAREIALGLARGGCQQYGARLRDDTILLTSQKPVWLSEARRMTIRRTYEFHLIDTKAQQHTGWIVMEGEVLESMMLDGTSTPVLHEDHEAGWSEDMGDTRGFGSNKCGGFKIASGCGTGMAPPVGGCGSKGCDTKSPQESGDGA